jgi:hypothetical protein
VEDYPWAEPWARVTTALANAVAVLARELSWQGTAREYRLKLEKRGHDCEALSTVRAEEPTATTSPLDWD